MCVLKGGPNKKSHLGALSSGLAPSSFFSFKRERMGAQGQVLGQLDLAMNPQNHRIQHREAPLFPKVQVLPTDSNDRRMRVPDHRWQQMEEGTNQEGLSRPGPHRRAKPGPFLSLHTDALGNTEMIFKDEPDTVRPGSISTNVQNIRKLSGSLTL